jgi:hypothetical protein
MGRCGRVRPFDASEPLARTTASEVPQAAGRVAEMGEGGGHVVHSREHASTIRVSALVPRTEVHCSSSPISADAGGILDPAATGADQSRTAKQGCRPQSLTP